MSDNQSTVFQRALIDAVNKPGSMMAAYQAFHEYSVGNQLLALFQCIGREIPIGPLATYNGWKAKGRQVRRGQSALVLCQPVQKKFTRTNKETGEDETGAYTLFTYKPKWFALSQTDGPDVEFPPLKEFNLEAALTGLEITQVPFESLSGNVQGYARKREVAINPVAQVPMKTMFHELGHIVLGHTAEVEFADSEQTPRNLREVEAEAVALLCLEALQLDGAEFCRGYIQHWLKDETIPEKSAQKIMTAANKILKAGRGESRPDTLSDDDREAIRAAKTDEVNYL